MNVIVKFQEVWGYLLDCYELNMYTEHVEDDVQFLVGITTGVCFAEFCCSCISITTGVRFAVYCYALRR